MKKCLVFNTVHSDGVGDFKHFEDILKALLANPKFNDIEFIPIVLFESDGKEANYKRMHEKLKKLGIPFLYGTEDEHEKFSSNESIKKLVGDADQALNISYTAGEVTELYQPYLKANLPIKPIAEHEFNATGLGLTARGIKIADIPPIEPNEAWATIQKHDPGFAEELLTRTHAHNFETFRDTNTLIPAYYNKSEPFFRFLKFLAKNESFAHDKDMAMYFSGMSLEDFNGSFIEHGHALKTGPFKSIEIIKAGESEPTIFTCNPEGSRTLRVFTGNFVSDATYSACHQLADMVGVSGDNSFEQAVSMNKFPYYISTNDDMKKATLLALRRITQLESLPIPDNARRAYATFYKNGNCESGDLEEMINYWPVVTQYLRENNNFYDQLDKIVLQGMNEPDLNQTQSVSRPKSAAFGDTLDLYDSFKIEEANIQSSVSIKEKLGTIVSEENTADPKKTPSL